MYTNEERQGMLTENRTLLSPHGELNSLAKLEEIVHDVKKDIFFCFLQEINYRLQRRIKCSLKHCRIKRWKKLARFQLVTHLPFIHSYSIDYLKDIN